MTEYFRDGSARTVVRAAALRDSEREAEFPTCYLTHSQYADTGSTSLTADPITPGAWQGSHQSGNKTQFDPRLSGSPADTSPPDHRVDRFSPGVKRRIKRARSPHPLVCYHCLSVHAGKNVVCSQSRLEASVPLYYDGIGL